MIQYKLQILFCFKIFTKENRGNMILELCNTNSQMISSVRLIYRQHADSSRRGYSAVVIPGTSHKFFLVLSTYWCCIKECDGSHGNGGCYNNNDK